jgi:prepilin signal peptidase PulO-like enzyme (type II secretory pathway)
LPDVLTIPGIVAGLAVGALTTLLGTTGRVLFVHSLRPFYFDPFSLTSSAIGALVGAGVILLIVWLSRGGMGYGDVKFLAMVGAFTGARGAFATLFLGALLGSIVGIFLLATGRKKRKDAIPFGPFLAVAVILLTFITTPSLNFFNLGG